jgi:hypothetical protein
VSYRDEQRAGAALSLLHQAIQLGDTAVVLPPIVLEEIRTA